MTSILAIFGALSIASSSTATLHANSREVRYDDLDLSTVSGTKALHRRVESAINSICADRSGPWLGAIDFDCKADTWASVRDQLDTKIAAARTMDVELASSDPLPTER
jgi:UrcA family protein